MSVVRYLWECPSHKTVRPPHNTFSRDQLIKIEMKSPFVRRVKPKVVHRK